MIKDFSCAECHELAVDGLGELTFTLPEGQITLRNIPAKVCPNGHYYYEGPTAIYAQRLARRVLEDLQSYQRDLNLSTIAPEEISFTAVARRPAERAAA